MAVGGFPAGLAAVWPSMLIVGCGIFHRELLMDIKDISGDAMTGVPTVPVLLGRDGAYFVSLVPLLGAGLTAAVGAPGARVAVAAVGPICIMLALSLKAKAGGFSKPSLALAIESAPVWLACSIGTLMRAA